MKNSSLSPGHSSIPRTKTNSFHCKGGNVNTPGLIESRSLSCLSAPELRTHFLIFFELICSSPGSAVISRHGHHHWIYAWRLVTEDGSSMTCHSAHHTHSNRALYLCVGEWCFFVRGCVCLHVCVCLWCVDVCVGVCVFVCGGVTEPEHASLRRAQEVPAVARHREHWSDRRAPPQGHGRQRAERPLRPLPHGPPEVQEQGTQNPLCLGYNRDEKGKTSVVGMIWSLLFESFIKD